MASAAEDNPEGGRADPPAHAEARGRTRERLSSTLHSYTVSCGSSDDQTSKALLLLPCIISIAHRPTLLVTIVLVDENGDPSHVPRPTHPQGESTDISDHFPSVVVNNQSL